MTVTDYRRGPTLAPADATLRRLSPQEGSPAYQAVAGAAEQGRYAAATKYGPPCPSV